MPPVIHLTSAHQRYDTRIFRKMCASLVNNGYNVSLIVADGNGDTICNGVPIYDVGASKGRFDRILNAPKRVFTKAIALDAKVYHLHDPELIFIGLKLKRLGKKVIFDSHEDVPKDILSKHYLNPLLRYLLCAIFIWLERFTLPYFDAVIAATPSIRDKFLKLNKFTVDINNFPIQEELVPNSQITVLRSNVCYVGGIDAIRGIREIIRAMEHVRSDVRLVLAGSFSEPSVSNEVRQYPGWAKVDELGFVDRAKVREILARSLTGIVTFLPVSNHIEAQPNKMFEYMSAGIPVVASNFPLWREIIEGNNCGLCVDPCDPQAIAEAIDKLVSDPELAHKMGQNGQRAIQRCYNWHAEEKKLLKLISDFT